MRLVAYDLTAAVDGAAAGRVLAAARADVACLLGVASSRILRAVARSSGLLVGARVGRRRPGNAVLVSEQALVRSSDTVPLITSRGVRDRDALHVIVGVGGTTLSVTAVAFGRRPDTREANLHALQGLLGSVDRPKIVCAGLQEPSTGPVASVLGQQYQDAFAVAGTGHGDTYPSRDPVSRRDYIYVDRTLTVRECTVATGADVEAAAHHRPVIAEIDAPTAGESET